MDLDDLHHDTDDGLHMASLAGGWISLVCGFGGLRDHGGRLALSPRLPSALTRLSFGLRWRGSLITVQIEQNHATYLLAEAPGDGVPGDEAPGDGAASPADGRPGIIEILHDGQVLQLIADRPVRVDLSPVEAATEPPSQPTGRRPR